MAATETEISMRDTKSDKPELNVMKSWPLDQVRAQYDVEQQEHVANLDKGSYRRDYHAVLTAHYRLGYMTWLLNGSPQPMPRFV